MLFKSNIMLKYILGLQVRVLLFLVTVTIGIVEGLSDLEESIPVALGYEAKDFTRQSILRHSEPTLALSTLICSQM